MARDGEEAKGIIGELKAGIVAVTDGICEVIITAPDADWPGASPTNSLTIVCAPAGTTPLLSVPSTAGRARSTTRAR
jgi:hypothetical protein